MVLLLRSSLCLLRKNISASPIQLKGCQHNAYVERRALPGYQNLLYRYEDQCETLGVYVNPLLSQKGHSIRALFCCRRCKQQRHTWSSSRVLAGHYVVNQKYVSLPAQEMKYRTLAKEGPWAVHLTLGQDWGMGRYSRYRYCIQT